MANEPTKDMSVLSPEAKTSRREYYRKWRANNRDTDRATKCRYWEKKAQEYYGADYIGPNSDGELSRQAREVRRKYFAEYRSKHPETINKAYQNYWERKANNHEKEC